jgi:sugar phosphate isomerase/epimerase
MAGIMEIGYCAPLGDADALKDIGYDFIEPKLLDHLLADQQELAAAKKTVARSSLPIRAFNAFFPHDMRLVGPNVDVNQLKSYLGRAAELVSFAGAEVAVMGSPWSRNVPEGYERVRAEEQLLHAYGMAAEAFHESGAVLAIEPQNRKEANIVNSIADGVAYARAVNRPELKVMADFDHMDEENEPLAALIEYADWIVHVQLADTGRNHPGTGSYDYDTFVDNLSTSGYPGRVSVEMMHEISDTEKAYSLQFLRSHWAKPRNGR